MIDSVILRSAFTEFKQFTKINCSRDFLLVVKKSNLATLLHKNNNLYKKSNNDQKLCSIYIFI